MSTHSTPDHQHIRIWVAVDDSGEGYILAWDGCREAPDGAEDMFAVHNWFSELVGMGGPETETWPLDHPDGPGLYRFDGRMYWHPSPTVAEPDQGSEAFDGTWTTLYTLPDLTQESNG